MKSSTGSLPNALAEEAGHAVARAVAWLDRVQLPTGEIPVLASTDPSLATGGVSDPSIFPTAVAALALAHCPEAAQVHVRACRFLLAERDGHFLWRHWTRDHQHHSSLPPDMDDTSCASAALAGQVEGPPPNRELLLANRRADGLFLTWFLPPPLRSLGLFRATFAQLGHLPTLFLFFRSTSAAPGDVDAVVNANALFYLRDFERRDDVVAFLLAILRDGREAVCDKWYENPFAVCYFLSRALRSIGAPAGDLLISRLAAAGPPATALDAAFVVCIRLDWSRDPGSSALSTLLDFQLPDGAWPRAALYHGGRERLRGGSFAPRHPDTPHWGSEALTTAFCLEALARWREFAS